MSDDDHEAGYTRGSRMAWVLMLGQCVKQLGIEDPDAARTAWIAERELAIGVLRQLCKEHGDNDWPETLALPDIIEKHLGRYLD